MGKARALAPKDPEVVENWEVLQENLSAARKRRGQERGAGGETEAAIDARREDDGQ